jgi:hypothetical protein
VAEKVKPLNLPKRWDSSGQNHRALTLFPASYSWSWVRNNYHPIKSRMYDIDQMKEYCIFCRMKKSKSFCRWYCSSAQLRMEHCCHLLSLLYRKSTCFAVWRTSARDILHHGALCWYHRHVHTEKCNMNWLQSITELLSGMPLLLLTVILANRIKQTS